MATPLRELPTVPDTLPTPAEIEAVEKSIGRALNDFEMLVAQLRRFNERVDAVADRMDQAELRTVAPHYEQIGRLWVFLSETKEYDLAAFGREVDEALKIVT